MNVLPSRRTTDDASGTVWLEHHLPCTPHRAPRSLGLLPLFARLRTAGT